MYTNAFYWLWSLEVFQPIQKAPSPLIIEYIDNRLTDWNYSGKRGDVDANIWL